MKLIIAIVALFVISVVSGLVYMANAVDQSDPWNISDPVIAGVSNEDTGDYNFMTGMSNLESVELDVAIEPLEDETIYNARFVVTVTKVYVKPVSIVPVMK